MTQQLLDLSKTFELDLQKAGFTTIPVLRTRLAIDRSGSMSGLFRSGYVKKLVDLFLGAALKFDDNGELEYTYFNSNATNMETVDLNNYSRFQLKDVGGGTNYVPALEELFDLGEEKPSGISKLFGFGSKKSTSSEPPVYIGFVTDGEPGDQSEVVSFLKKHEESRNFVQVIVLGSGNVGAGLRNTLASFKNTALTVIEDPTRMTTEELYQAMANQKLLDWTNSVK